MAGWWSSTSGRLVGGVRIGVLSRWVPPDLVEEVLSETAAEAAAGAGGGVVRGRRFRALPLRLGVYFVLGLCLHSDLSYRQVLRTLAGDLEAGLAAAGWQVPASTALTGVRQRLGEAPFRVLLSRLCGPLSPGRAAWSHICGLLAVAWDGTTVRVPAAAENMTAFGQPGGKNAGHYPQVRLVTLIACGTRALLGAQLGPWRGTGERELAAGLLGRLGAGMLLLADRGFYSYQLWQSAAGTGAHLLWRVQGNVHLPVVRSLPDGSWISVLAHPRERHRRSTRNHHRRTRSSKLPQQTGPLPGITVRVIEFIVTVTADDGSTRAEPYRLITTLTGHQAYPAAALAAGYAWRWAIETGFREFKTYLASHVLRGRTPALARQEIWAYLVIYQAIRILICVTAAAASLDPDRLSFTAAMHATRRSHDAARTTPAAAQARAEAAILTEPVPHRPGRICVRAITERYTRYPSRDKARPPLSQHAGYTVTITRPDPATPAPAHQEKQPSQNQHSPP